MPKYRTNMERSFDPETEDRMTREPDMADPSFERKAVRMWLQKSLKRLERKGSADVEFNSPYIGDTQHDWALSRLMDARTPEDVRRIFNEEFPGMTVDR